MYFWASRECVHATLYLTATDRRLVEKHFYNIVLTITAIVLAFTAHSCVDEPGYIYYPMQSQESSQGRLLTHYNYFPLAVGNKWIYRERSVYLIYYDTIIRILDTNTIADTMTIQRTIQDTSGTWWYVRNRQYRAVGTGWWPAFEFFQYTTRRDTVYERGDYRGIPISGLKYIPLPTTDSVSYISVGVTEYLTGTNMPLSVSARVSPQSVETPAGIFANCAEYYYSYDVDSRDRLYITEFVAPRVGLVKKITERRDMRYGDYAIIGYQELTSYSLEGEKRR